MGRGGTHSALVLFKRGARGAGAAAGDDVPMSRLWLSRVVREAERLRPDYVSMVTPLIRLTLENGARPAHTGGAARSLPRRCASR